MKSFKELKTNIYESGEHTFGGGFGDTFVHTHGDSVAKDYGSGIFDICADDNINRVNAFLNAYFRREFVDYSTQLGQLKTKLKIGMSWMNRIVYSGLPSKSKKKVLGVFFTPSERILITAYSSYLRLFETK